jgi:maleylpyruvate isomerase
MVARHDLATDPGLQDELLQARRGTAFFARKLNELSDAELDGGTRLPDWSRRHVVAHVGYNARAIARLVEWAATGVETPMYPSPEARNQEINFGATLSPIALRNLFDHSAVHLSVEWRDLPDANWAKKSAPPKAAPCPPPKLCGCAPAKCGSTPWTWTTEPRSTTSRHRSSSGSSATSQGHGRPAALTPDSSSKSPTAALTFGDTSAADPTIITGPLPAVVEWATGRGSNGVSAGGPGALLNEVPAAPPWI